MRPEDVEKGVAYKFISKIIDHPMNGHIMQAESYAEPYEHFNPLSTGCRCLLCFGVTVVKVLVVTEMISGYACPCALWPIEDPGEEEIQEEKLEVEA